MIQFPPIDALVRGVSPGVPVGVRPGCNLDSELAYENHSSTDVHINAMHWGVVSDVRARPVLVFIFGMPAKTWV